MSFIDEIVDFAAFFSCTKTKKDQDSSGGTGRDGALQNAGRDGSGKQAADGTGRDGTAFLSSRGALVRELSVFLFVDR